VDFLSLIRFKAKKQEVTKYKFIYSSLDPTRKKEQEEEEVNEIN
jgi:hypothetical protein